MIDEFYTVSFPNVESWLRRLPQIARYFLKKEFRHACSEENKCPAGMLEETEIDPMIVAKK